MTLLERKITDSIFSNNFYGFKEISEIVQILIVEYSQDNLNTLCAILKNGEYDKLITLSPVKYLFGEHLTVFKFLDQKSTRFYGIYYDAGELFQDPVVYEVFKNVG